MVNNKLKVIYNWGEKEFPKVTRVSVFSEKFGFGVRLFGNGGVFCGTGIFWCTKLGLFRAYVTSARKEDYVLVETATHKILISPENPEQFVKDLTPKILPNFKPEISKGNNSLPVCQVC